MCASVDQKQKPMVMLIAVAVTVNSAEKLERLKRLAECPACTLAALRQAKAFDGEFRIEFDYRVEAKAFWQDRDREWAQREALGY